MESVAFIRSFLAEVRRDLRQRARRRVGLYTVAGVGVVATLLPLWAARGGPRGDGIWLVGGAVLLGLVVLGRGFLAPARRWRGARDVARFVGTRRPELASDLLSTVELAPAIGGGPERPGAPISAALVGALIDATATRLREVGSPVLVPRDLGRPGRLALASAALLIACVALWPTRMARGLRNLVSAGDRGPFADAARSDLPLASDVVITLAPPAYTHRPSATLPSSSGDFRAMAGTTVKLEATAMADAATGFLVFDGPDGHGAPRLVPLAVIGKNLSASFAVDRATHYRFLLESGTGARRIESVSHAIELEPDNPPTVELHAPADELEVTGQKRIELAYVAEDDYGLTRAELVWSSPDGERRMPLELPHGELAPRSAQQVFLWDLADVALEPGARVSYHVEVRDGDTVGGPNVGRSRTYTLRLLSPREKHEHLIDAEREAYEHMVGSLADRLTIAAADGPSHETAARGLGQLVVELGTLVAAQKGDPLADRKLSGVLDEMRARLDRLVQREGRAVKRWLKPGAAPLSPAAMTQLGAGDRATATELEDDVLTLADWLDRQGLENLLAISDEVKLHQQRLAKLLAELKRTGSDETRKEVDRELRALEHALGELEQKRGRLPEDVLDQFVNGEALHGKEAEGCVAEARRLLAAGDRDGAARKLAACDDLMNQSSASLEQSLAELRGDRFGGEEKKLGEVMNQLADLGHDQRKVADEASALQRRYGDKAAALVRGKAQATQKHVADTLERLKRKVAEVSPGGLGEFEREELGAAATRLEDLSRMLGDGDIAEAMAMAREAEASLEMVEAELGANLEDEDDRRWRHQLEDSLGGVDKALPLAKKLVKELDEATPSPERVLDKDDLAKLERLGKTQEALARRARELGDKARAMAPELPGKAGEQIAERVTGASQSMDRSAQQMRAHDPTGARQEAEAAAKALEKAKDEAQGAARLRQTGGASGLRDEPIRIPGADEYKPPEKFREDLLEAMKKHGEAPAAYEEMIKRYYEELVR